MGFFQLEERGVIGMLISMIKMAYCGEISPGWQLNRHAPSTLLLMQITMALVTSSNAVITLRMNVSLDEIPNDMDISSTKIDLSYNNITVCRNLTFKLFSSLTELVLDNNNIDTIETNAFVGTALTLVSLNNNRVVNIPNLDEISSTLNTLNLSWNLITQVSILDFVKFASLTTLRLTGNPLITFDAPESLSVDGNITFYSHCLQELDMQYVSANVVSGASFSGLTCLHSLYLDHTNITSFDDIHNTRALNSTLDTLSLTGNQISTVPEEMLHDLFRLSTLHVERNEIKVYPEIIATLANTVRAGGFLNIYLYDNPTVCVCDWSWLIGVSFFNVTAPDTGKFFDVAKKFIMYIDTQLCSIGGPDSLRHYSWTDLTKALLCPPTTSTLSVSKTAAMDQTTTTVINVAPTTTETEAVTSTTGNEEVTPDVMTSEPDVETAMSTASSVAELAGPTTASVVAEPTGTSNPVTATTLHPLAVEVISWNTWIAWSECNSLCGGGYQFSLKICDVVNQTDDCTSPLKRDDEIVLYYTISQQSCNDHPCPVDGYWVTWSNWTTCSATCGIGTRTRTRKCIGPFYAGEDCGDVDHEYSLCVLDDCIINKIQPVDLHDGEVYLEADKRESAVGIGVLAIALLAIELSIVMLLDMHSIVLGCRKLSKSGFFKCGKKKSVTEVNSITQKR